MIGSSLPFCVLTFAFCVAPAPEWGEFRGPNGTGKYDGPPVVVEWGTATNVTWKVPVPGRGWSSPVFADGKLFLTTAVPADPKDEKTNYSLRALCLNPADGKTLWDVELFIEEGKSAPPPHKKNSHASPTPVTDGQFVYVHFGHAGTAKLDLAGKVVWKTQQYAFKPVHGNGGSPILVGDKLVFSCDGMDKQVVVAVDVKTGAPAWTTERKMSARLPFSFATAHAMPVNGKTQIISPASDYVAGYDAVDGKEIWRAKYPKPGWSVITRPVVAGGLVIIQTGYTSQHLMAIDPTGTGEVTAEVKWTNRKEAPNTPTPLAVGDDLYVVADQGFFSNLDPKTGQVRWSERLAGKAYSASPILANGLIYVTSEEGVGQVIRPSREKLDEVSKSELGEKTFASFVPVAGSLYVRTETLLYRFDGKK